MNKSKQIRNSCGGKGCSKDLFTLPYAGGRRRVGQRRLNIRTKRKGVPV